VNSNDQGTPVRHVIVSLVIAACAVAGTVVVTFGTPAAAASAVAVPS